MPEEGREPIRQDEKRKAESQADGRRQKGKEKKSMLNFFERVRRLEDRAAELERRMAALEQAEKQESADGGDMPNVSRILDEWMNGGHE